MNITQKTLDNVLFKCPKCGHGRIGLSESLEMHGAPVRYCAAFPCKVAWDILEDDDFVTAKEAPDPYKRFKDALKAGLQVAVRYTGTNKFCIDTEFMFNSNPSSYYVIGEDLPQKPTQEWVDNNTPKEVVARRQRLLLTDECREPNSEYIVLEHTGRKRAPGHVDFCKGWTTIPRPLTSADWRWILKTVDVEPTWIPWSYATMPAIVRVRHKKAANKQGDLLIISRHEDHVAIISMLGTRMRLTYKDLLAEWETHDGLPCGEKR